MAWRRSGNKPLSAPIMVSYISVTQPQWVKCFHLNNTGFQIKLYVSIFSSFLNPYTLDCYLGHILGIERECFACASNGPLCRSYRQVSNIRRTWVGNEVVDHSDVVGVSPVGAALTTPSFSTERLTSIYCAKTTASWVEKHLSFGIWCVIY